MLPDRCGLMVVVVAIVATVGWVTVEQQGD
jgi:hypothetical protein